MLHFSINRRFFSGGFAFWSLLFLLILFGCRQDEALQVNHTEGLDTYLIYEREGMVGQLVDVRFEKEDSPSGRRYTIQGFSDTDAGIRRITLTLNDLTPGDYAATAFTFQEELIAADDQNPYLAFYCEWPCEKLSFSLFFETPESEYLEGTFSGEVLERLPSQNLDLGYVPVRGSFRVRR